MIKNYVCVDGKKYYLGQTYEFYDDEDKKMRGELAGYIKKHPCPWVIIDYSGLCVSYKFIREMKPQRPEIAIDEPVFDATGNPRHFAGWFEDGKPLCFSNGRTSHTESGLYFTARITTKSGQVWPPEVTNEN